MRTPYAVLFLLSLLVGGTYWYTSVGAICRTPISYYIGTIDDRFAITKEEAQNVLEGAASIWEDATGRNLFTYDLNGDVAVNFVYDSRQQSFEEAGKLKNELDKTRSLSDELEEQYAQLIASYNDKKATFEDRRERFERDLAVYNQMVDSYNQQGGAPQTVYEELEAERKRLDTEQNTIESMSRELSKLTDELNNLSQEINLVVDEYNKDVSVFNQQYATSEEFTQGDYQGDSINIYKFQSREELELVLAHELGHALALDHVDNDMAIMYYLMGDQPIDDIHLTPEDLAEFGAVCGEVTPKERLGRMYTRLFNWFKNVTTL